MRDRECVDHSYCWLSLEVFMRAKYDFLHKRRQNIMISGNTSPGDTGIALKHRWQGSVQDRVEEE